VPLSTSLALLSFFSYPFFSFFYPFFPFLAVYKFLILALRSKSQQRITQMGRKDVEYLRYVQCSGVTQQISLTRLGEGRRRRGGGREIGREEVEGERGRVREIGREEVEGKERENRKGR
jgi:hypothetical protein